MIYDKTNQDRICFFIENFSWFLIFSFREKENINITGTLPESLVTLVGTIGLKNLWSARSPVVHDDWRHLLCARVRPFQVANQNHYIFFRILLTLQRWLSFTHIIQNIFYTPCYYKDIIQFWIMSTLTFICRNSYIWSDLRWRRGKLILVLTMSMKLPGE